MLKYRDFNKLLKNKIVYYVVVVAAFLHLVGYMSIRNFDALGFFVAVGLLSTFFSKNKVVNMLIAIVATNLMYTGSFIREGLENKKEGMDHEEEDDEDAKEEGMEHKKDEKFTQMNIPSSKPKSLSEDESEGSRIDYASTMEQAYDNLQNILGSGGMKGLTAETEKLVKQQQNLVTSLNSMSPALKSAQKTMEMFGANMPNFEKMTSFLQEGHTKKNGKKK
tara:strand:+ start:5889 stop:6551 length:663 start_codon:yes stop_codon:yes gene_type:complete